MNVRRFAFAAATVLLGLLPQSVLADPLKIFGTPFEMVVSQVSDQTIRVVLSPLDEKGQACPSPVSTVLVDFPATELLRTRDLAQAKNVSAGAMRISFNATPPTISLHRADGTLIQEIMLSTTDGSLTFRTDAPVFGLGEGRNQFDRRGGFYNFVNGQNTLLRTNGTTMPVPFVIGADGWGLFFHNPPASGDPRSPWCEFDMRDSRFGRFVPRLGALRTSPVQMFIMDLKHPADALQEYIRLTGHPAMPPKWVMGYMQSHRSLTSPQEIMQVARKFREDQLPCDALIYLGSGYTNDGNGQSGWNTGHGSLVFNPRIFDKPREIIDALHQLNFKVVLHENAAPAGLFGASVDEPSADPLHISNYWARHLNLMKMGIDAWWPDDGDELPIENRLARLRLYYQGPLRDRPNERPWSLDRNGYAGAAKYGAWNWSGDVASTWQTLANHVPVGLNFSLSVSPWWGTDTGGFNASSEYTGELYTRWFEFSAFTPLFRSHGRNWHLHTPFGWNTGEVGPVESRPPPPESELHNAEVEPICKKYLELRYSLLPYNYTIVREACDTGLPPMRALWLNYPDDPQAVPLGDEYLWGPDILVAPVVTKGATTRRLYLPAGDWYDWWTNKKVAGKQWIDRPADLATLPLYVKAGAIIPIDPVRQYVSEPVTEPTTLRIYQGANGAFTLYDDDGHTQDYLSDSDPQAQWIKFTYDDAANTLSIDPDPRMKQPAINRVFRVQIAGSDKLAKDVEFAGKHVAVNF